MLLIAPIALCRLVRYRLFSDIEKKESALRTASNVSAVSAELATLCQTCAAHPDWFVDEPVLAPAWAGAILELEPSWVNIGAEGAQVEFGGGFFHFGYLLEREDAPAGNEDEFTWRLSLYSEESPDVPLKTFKMPKECVLTESQFVDRTLDELDRRITAGHDLRASGSPNSFASVQRCTFAMKHDQLKRLRRSIRDTAKNCPDAWRDVLLAYLIDSPADPAGAKARLEQWAESKRGFSGWLMVAYAFHEGGDVGAAEEAVLRACEFPADDPPWVPVNARCRGLGMCRRLFAAQRFDACLRLVGVLLTYSGSRDYLANELLAIQAACRSSQTSTGPSALPAVNPLVVFDPFEGIDIAALRATPDR